MKSAIKFVKNKGVSIKRAAQLFGINRTTLLNHLKNYKFKDVGRPTVLRKKKN